MNVPPQRQIKKQPGYMDFMCRLHRDLLNLTQFFRFDKTHPWHLNLVLLYGTILELQGSACVLIREDSTIGVAILLRSALEANLDFVNLAQDRKYFSYMRAAELKEWIKLLKEAKTEENPFLAGVADIPGSNQTLLDYETESKKLIKDGYPPLRQDQKFDKAGLTSVYKSVYNSLCCCTHNNIRALQMRHLNFDFDKVDFTVEFNAPFDPVQLLSYVDAFCGIAISSSEALHNILETDGRDKLLALRKQWEELRRELIGS